MIHKQINPMFEVAWCSSLIDDVVLAWNWDEVTCEDCKTYMWQDILR